MFGIEEVSNVWILAWERVMALTDK